MFANSKRQFFRIDWLVPLFTLAFVLMLLGPLARAQEPETASKLRGFDSYMEQVLKGWNTPGIGVCIVVNNKLTTSLAVAFTVIS